MSSSVAHTLPGAFPSDTPVVENNQLAQDHEGTSPSTGTTTADDAKLAAKAKHLAEQQHAAHTAGRETGTTRTSDLASQGDKAGEFQAQQNAAHTVGGKKTDKYVPVSQQEHVRAGAGAHPAQNSEAWTDVSNPEALVQNTGEKASATTSSTPGVTSGGAQQTSSAPETSGIDLGSIGTGLAETATAFGLAAKDVLLAAKDAAAPAASAATEQAKNLAGYAQENAVPAANYTAEQTQNAAVYTKDTAASGISSASQQASGLTSTDTVPTGGVLDTANTAANYAKDTAYTAANTAQSYAPNVLGEPDGIGRTARDIASEVPLTVKESVSQAGESPKAATNAQAVGQKSQVETELLGSSHGHSQEDTRAPENAATRAPENVASRVNKGLSLEERLMPDSLTPGVAKVLGTENDRSFPLGAADGKSEWLSNSQPESKTAGEKPMSQ